MSRGGLIPVMRDRDMSMALVCAVGMVAWGGRLRAFFRRLTRRGPQSAADFIARGDSYLASREYDKAVADFTEAIRLDPKNPLGYRRRAATFQAIGDALQTSLDTRKACQLESLLKPPEPPTPGMDETLH